MNKKILPAVTLATFLLCTCTSPSTDVGTNSASDNDTALNTPKYNVLLLTVDDLNPMVGAWDGPAITPNMDKLAAQSIKFTNAYSVVPLCAPSRTALLTGQRPERTGAYNNEHDFRRIPPSKGIETLPQRLQREGYKTVAAGKIFHFSRRSAKNPSPLSDPISWTYQPPLKTGRGKLLPEWKKNSNFVNSGKKRDYRNSIHWGAIKETRENTRDGRTSKYCADFLSQEHDGPFMLGCGLFRPHLPFLAPEEFFDLYPLDSLTLPETKADDRDDLPGTAQSPMSDSTFMNGRAEAMKYAFQGYLAASSVADANIGEILTALENSPYSDNTIVIFMGDHGFQFNQKGQFGKGQLWRESTRTPLSIRLPNAKVGSTNEAVSLIDVYPTVLEALGLDTDQTLDGDSLMPFFENITYDRKTPAVITNTRGGVSVVLDDWNYIRYEDGGEELYNHSNDLKEWDNLLYSAPDKYRATADRLKKHFPDVLITPGQYKTPRE